MRVRPYTSPVHHRFRGPIVALVALVLTLSCSLNAEATRTAVQPAGDRTTFTHAEAKNVLSRAKAILGGDSQKATTTRSSSGDLTMVLRDLYLARRYLGAADRSTATRLLSRDTAAAEARSNKGTALKVKCSAHFCLHYGTDTKATWATTTLDTLENVWKAEVGYMGRTPLPDGGSSSTAPGNPDARLDVTLENIGDQGLYGYCEPSDLNSTATQVAASCVLDNNYSRSEFGADPLKSLQVTAAHEFFHTIQFAMDISESLWFMEGTAVWMEDYVYDSINDNYQYLATSPIRHPGTSLDSSSSTFPYGSFIFFTYSSERAGTSVVRRYWDGAVGPTTALSSIYSLVGASSWPTFFATFGSWNTVPAHTYSERAGYPSAVWSVSKTLSTRSPSTGYRTVGIPRLAHSNVLIRPDTKLSTSKHLLITVNGPNASLGTTALLQRRYVDGRVTHNRIRLDAYGNGHILISFNRKALRAVVVVLSNTSRSGGRHGFKVRAGVH